MQGAPYVALGALAIEPIGNLECFGVRLEDAAQARPATVNRLDARELLLDELASGELAAPHARLQLLDRDLFDVHAVAQDNSR
jgi:hypothetical protein